MKPANGTIKTMHIISFDCTWSIRRFESLSSSRDISMISPIFSSANKIADDWRLELRTHNFHDNDEGYLSMNLCLTNCKVDEVKVEFYLNILRNDMTNGNHEKHLIANFKKESKNGFQNFVSKADILCPANRYLQDGTLTIYCRIKFPFPNRDFTNRQDHFNSINTNKSESLSNDLKYLLNDPTESDVTIIVDNSKILAHRLILSARSSVFAEILSNHSNSQPNSNNNSSGPHHTNLPSAKRMKFSAGCCELEDISLEAAKKMMIFIYSDDTSNIAPHTRELLIAANRYKLGSLKSACEEILMKDLTLENATEILIIADGQNAPALKKIVIEFIFKHFKEIAQTAGYLDLKKNHPMLLGEILEGNLC